MQDSVITKNILIRQTVIYAEHFNTLPLERRKKILSLLQEFDKLHYIDASLLLPTQQGRMSKREINKMQQTALRVFSIESQIKELLQLNAETEIKARNNKLNCLGARKAQMVSQISMLKTAFNHKITSVRPNKVKSTYENYLSELANIEREIEELKKMAKDSNTFDEKQEKQP